METHFSTRDLGNTTVTAVSDGALQVDFSLLSPIETAECEQIQRHKQVLEPNGININTFLVRHQGKHILIDSGIGGIRGLGGKLNTHLAALGVAPDDIDTVLLTHAHPDHIGGLLTAEGEAVFQNAELVVSSKEYHYLNDDSHFRAASERIQGNFTLARRVFDHYQRHLRLVDQGEVIAGIFAVPLPGHTPGHLGYRIEGSQDQLFIWGDIVHFPHIQLLKPEVSIAFDYDAVLAAETRRRLLDEVSADNMLIGGMHFGPDGFGRVGRYQSGYEIIYCNEA
ncbi:MBL fold metallo-hydrolase [Pantoea sp. A4]|uniref:MBL fold metallo-hydrolase n=1 Tax=Pantoea sp. A4 TaxID=1225184 RepID=UPI00037B5437|nr:MBL fold metallo-hydrolase [Pantoea sp. A4]